MEFQGVTPQPSFKSKLKSSLYFYCCFRRRRRRPDGSHRQVLDSPPPPPTPSDEKPTLLWMNTTPPAIKDIKCMTIFGRGGVCGGNGSNKHKRHPSAEFRYDPLSYSLNFEDGFDDDDEYYPLRNNFSARLPPPSQPPVREITASS